MRRLGIELRRSVRRRLGRHTTHTASAKLEMAIETNAAGEVIPGRRSSPQVVKMLYELESRIGAVESRQESASRELDDRLDALSRDVQEMIERSKDRYLGLRMVGLAIALVGALLLSAANLV